LRVVLALVLQHHPHSAFTNPRGKRWGSLRHGSILARVGASGKSGAVHWWTDSDRWFRVAPLPAPHGREA
jgi:hypothetical protein